MRWRSVKEGKGVVATALCCVMEAMVCANEFLPSVPKAETPSMLGGFFSACLGASQEELH